MKYCIENELNTMDFHDASILEVDWDQKGAADSVLTFTVTGAIVKADNSQNELYTDRYADTMNLRFTGVVFQAILLEGHKLYDANDKLIEQVPDRPFKPEEYKQVLKRFANSAVFYAGAPKEKVVENYVNYSAPQPDGTSQDEAVDYSKKECFQMIIDTEEDDNPSYVVSFFYDKVTAEFEHFLNKANIM